MLRRLAPALLARPALVRPRAGAPPIAQSLCRRSMFIQTETTPNPASLKFLREELGVRSQTKPPVPLAFMRPREISQRHSFCLTGADPEPARPRGAIPNLPRPHARTPGL